MYRVLVVALLAIGCTKVAKPKPAVVVDPPAGPGAMAPRLASDGSAVLLSWIEGNKLRYSRWTGQSWSAPIDLVQSEKMFANWADTPGVARDAKGIVAHWLQKSGDAKYAYDVVAGRAGDSAFTVLGPVHDDGTATEHGFVSTAREGDKLRLFWLDGRQMAAEPPGPMTLRTGMLGEPSAVVDERVCDCCGTAAVTTTTGTAVAYRDRTEAEIRDISVAVSTPTGWKSTVVAQDGWETQGCPVNGPALGEDGGALALAWFTAAGGVAKVRVSFSSNGGTAWGAPLDVATTGGDVEPLGRVDLLQVSSTSAIVTWVETQGGDAAIRARRVSSTGELSAVSTLAWTLAARSSGFPRVARFGDQLVLTWTEASAPTRVRARSFPLADIGRVYLDEQHRAQRTTPYEARTLDGNALKLPIGEPYILNFWATWCAPCREELSILAENHKTTGVKTIAISLDDASEAAAIAELAAALKLGFQVAHDPANNAATHFRVPAVPTTLVFDASGAEKLRKTGLLNLKELRQQISDTPEE